MLLKSQLAEKILSVLSLCTKFPYLLMKMQSETKLQVFLTNV